MPPMRLCAREILREAYASRKATFAPHSVLERLPLQTPDAAKLIDLADFATEDEEHRGIVDSRHHDDDDVQRPGIEASGVERFEECREPVLRQFEHAAGEDRGQQRSLPPNSPHGQELVE